MEDVPPVGRRERKKRETRERILDAASTLITDQGLAATTIDEIAERADIADIQAAQERGEMRTDRSATDLADAALGLYFSVLLFWDPNSGEPVGERLDGTRQLVADLFAGPAAAPAQRQAGGARRQPAQSP